MSLDPEEILALHREITAIPSISGSEAELAAWLERYLGERGAAVQRIGNSLLTCAGSGPLLLLDTHLDTVPPARGWSRDPHEVEVAGERVYGLGANDAKAAVAAMTAAFLTCAQEPLGIALGLALVEGEETRGTGTEAILAELNRRGQRPAAAVIGEPTALEIAVAQKGLLILELVCAGTECHAANARALGARNAIALLARDLVALEEIDLGPEHPLLGAITCEPTVLSGGVVRNMLPGEARAALDLRTTPVHSHEELIAHLEGALRHARLVIHSKRLVPRESSPDERIVRAARRTRPAATLYGSRTMSDMVFFEGIPAIKCGPGRTERSHTPDEYVLTSEILEGARFTTDLIRAYAHLNEEENDAQTLGQG